MLTPDTSRQDPSTSLGMTDRLKIHTSLYLEKQMVHNVLIVDDDPLTLRLCQKLLEQENIRVRSLENPMDVLQELEQHRPDIILLDYCMPNINGLETNRIIRQVYNTSEIPVLFMTGSMDQEVLADIKKETHLEPILKPINPIDFTSRVSTAIEQA